MAVEERERRDLQEALVGSIGSGQTDTLMHYLPPVGWADVATKHDLQTMRAEMAAIEGRLRTDMEAMEHRLRSHLSHELRIQFYWAATLIAVLLAAFVAALRLW